MSFMTKHVFTTKRKDGRNISVDMGWDRPLQYFFLTVFDPNAPEDEDDILYATLHDRRFRASGGVRNLHDMMKLLDEQGITPPEGLEAALAEDQRLNRGNAITRW